MSGTRNLQWAATQPITEIPLTGLEGEAPAAAIATQNLDCVFGTAAGDGKWTVSGCTTQPAGRTAKFGSICEQAQAPTTAPPGTSDSTCLKSGITVMIGMLFFYYQ